MIITLYNNISIRLSFRLVLPHLRVICKIILFMLNLTIAMKRAIVGFAVVLLLLGLVWNFGSAADGVLISSPKAGDALQGLVIINGSTDVSGFQSVEVAFNYLGGNPQSWFLIQQSKSAVKEGVLAVWDTTTIADGVYRLRVLVFLADGKTVQAMVENLRVRNYTPIETNTPDNANTGVTPIATALRPTITPRHTPSPFPPNPLEVRSGQITVSIIEGIVAALLGLMLLGLYVSAKRRR